MRIRNVQAVAIVGLLIYAVGCKKEIDQTQFKSAINTSLVAQHDCVWTAPVKLPAQADTSNDEQTRDFDALTDAGLLIRSSAEKKRFLIGSKQVNNYDLSDKGHSTWTADPNQPGYGNFCFGHYNVTAISSAAPNDSSNPTQYTVNYQYEVEGVPDWARTPETLRTFPKLAQDISIRSATATLLKDANGGWVVMPAQPAAPAPPTQ